MVDERKLVEDGIRGMLEKLVDYEDVETGIKKIQK